MGIYCNYCKHNFVPDLQEVEGYQYFLCPNCDKEYPVGTITPKGIIIRAELDKARQKLNMMIDCNYTKKAIRRQQKLTETLLAEYQEEYTMLG